MPETADKLNPIAGVYATALYALASEHRVVDQVRDELSELVKLQQLESGFAAFMSSSALDDDHRAAGLEKMFRGKLSDIVLNTLLVLNQHGRVGMLDALFREFVRRHEDASGEVKAVAITAAPVDGAVRQRIERVAAEVSGRRPVIEFRVDPSLLGGLVLQIGDWRYDNSVRRQLEAARRRLRERSERGLALPLSDALAVQV